MARRSRSIYSLHSNWNVHSRPGELQGFRSPDDNRSSEHLRTALRRDLFAG